MGMVTEEIKKYLQDIIFKFPQANIDTMSFIRECIKEPSLRLVNQEIISCNKCCYQNDKSPCKTIGAGNPYAEIMIIGDCPIDSQKQLNKYILAPFEGTKEGICFSNILSNFNLTVKDIFWLNAVNCYTQQTVDNHEIYRCPNSKEIDNCSYFVKKIVDIIHPKLIILCGAIALNCFKKISINKGHGIWTQAFTVPAMPIYNPTYLKNSKGKMPDNLIQKMQTDLIKDLTVAFEYYKKIKENEREQ